MRKREELLDLLDRVSWVAHCNKRALISEDECKRLSGFIRNCIGPEEIAWRGIPKTISACIEGEEKSTFTVASGEEVVVLKKKEGKRGNECGDDS